MQPLEQNLVTASLVESGLVQRGVGSYDPATAPFYSPVWNSLRSIEIPLWNPSTKAFEILFNAYIPPTGNQILFGGDFTDAASLYINSNSGNALTVWQGGVATTFSGINLDGSRFRLVFTPTDVTLHISGESFTVVRSFNQITNGVGHIGGAAVNTTERLDAGARLWDVLLLDKNEHENSRRYPVIEYRPDGSLSGTNAPQVLRQERVVNCCFEEGLTGWTNGITIANEDDTITVGSAGFIFQSPTAAYRHGNTYIATLVVDSVSGGSEGGAVRFETGNFTQSSWSGAGTFTFEFTWDASYINPRVQLTNDSAVTSVIRSFTMSQLNDGTLVGFPAGSEWELAQLSERP